MAALALALVQLRVGALFGAGNQLDAFLVGTATPALLLSLSASIVTALITPRLSRLQGDAAATRAGQFASVGLLFGVAVGAIVILLAPQIIAIAAPGLGTQGAQVATGVLRLYAIGFAPTIAAHVYGAYGYANGRVWAAGLSGTLYGSLWLALEFTPGFMSTAREVAVAGLLATVVQVTVAFRASTRWGDRLPWPRKPVLHRPAVAFLSISGMLVAAMYWRINLFLDPLYGSLLTRGSVAELTYAYRIVLLIIMICGQGSALAILAVSGMRGRTTDRETSVGLLVTTMVAVGLAAAMAFGSEQMAILVLGRGRFSYHDAREVGKIIALYSPAMVLITLCWALESLLMSAGRVKTIVRAGLAPFIINVGVTTVALSFLGKDARPLGVGCSALLYCALLLRKLQNDSRVRMIISRRVGRLLIATFATSSLTVISLQRVLTPEIDARIASLVACVAAGITTVLWILIALRPASVENILEQDRSMRRKNQRFQLAGMYWPERQWNRWWICSIISLAIGAAIAVSSQTAAVAAIIVLLVLILAGAVYYGPLVFGWLLIVVVPLVPVVEGGPFSLGSASTSSAVRIAIIVVALLGGMALVGGLVQKDKLSDGRLRSLEKGFLALASVGVLVSVGGAAGLQDLFKMISNASGQPLIYGGVILFFVTTLRAVPASRVQFLRALAVAIIFETAIVMYQYRSGAAFDVLRGYSRAQGTMGSDFLGTFALIAFFACAELRSKANSQNTRVLANVGAVCALISLVASLSRGPVIGLAGGIAFLMLNRQQSVSGAKRRPIVVGIAIVLLLGGGIYSSRHLWERRLTAQSTGAFDRPATWVSGIRIGEDHPLLGVGPGNVATEIANNPRYNSTQYGAVGVNPHNAWIYAFAEGGAFYALALAWLTILLIYTLLRHRRRTGRRDPFLTAGLVGVFPIFFINNIFTHPEIIIPVLLLFSIVTFSPPDTVRDTAEKEPRRLSDANEYTRLGVVTM